MRISQAALASLFGQVVSHRGELLLRRTKSGETPRARMTFCAVYAWAALAFQLCNRIERRWMIGHSMVRATTTFPTTTTSRRATSSPTPLRA